MKRFYAKFLFISAVVVWNIIVFIPSVLQYGMQGVVEDWREDAERIREFCESANKAIK